MGKNLNVGLIILAVVTALVFFASVFSLKQPKIDLDEPQQQEIPTNSEDDTDKIYINVFFIGQNKNGEEVYRAVKREYFPDIDGTPIEFALTSLFNGPKPDEVKFGVYSEIPVGTKLLKVIESNDASRE